MYRNLLIVFILFFTTALYSQSASLAINDDVVEESISKSNLKIYPNPASNFIQLQEPMGVSSIIIYNLVGRKIKQFKTEKGKSYSITDLPKGMYLIQLMGLTGKVLTTQRLSKR